MTVSVCEVGSESVSDSVSECVPGSSPLKPVGGAA